MMHIPLINTYQPGTDPLLLKVYTKSVDKLKQREVESLSDDINSDLARIFSTLLYSNYLRLEYANDKLRNAIAALRDDKRLYRHEVKKHAMCLRKEFAAWDSYAAHIMDHLDYYDALTDVYFKRFDPLYQTLYHTILQFTTRHEIKYGPIMASVSSALAVLEMTEAYMKQDIERYSMQTPLVKQLPKVLGIVPILHHARSMFGLLNSMSSKGRTDNPNVNLDKDIRQAEMNLSRLLGNTANLSVNAEELDNLPDRPEGMMTYDEIQSLRPITI